MRRTDYLTSSYQPLNPNVPAGGKYYFHFKFVHLHLSGEELFVASVILHLTGHGPSVWPININVNIDGITAVISKSQKFVPPTSRQRIKYLQHVKLNFAAEESKL
jgi:hypothetical protein